MRKALVFRPKPPPDVLVLLFQLGLDVPNQPTELRYLLENAAGTLGIPRLCAFSDTPLLSGLF